MSIWLSTPFNFDSVVQRDELTGDDTVVQIFVDVATASSWHDCVRLCVGTEIVLLTPTEVRTLISALGFAQRQIREKGSR